MNFFVLLSVDKTLQNYTLIQQKSQNFFPFSYLLVYYNKQFFLLANCARNINKKNSKIFSRTYLINIQPSCSLNGFSASNQTLQQQKKTESTKKVPERKESSLLQNRIECTLKKGKQSRCLIFRRNSLFKSFEKKTLSQLYFYHEKKSCNMLIYLQFCRLCTSIYFLILINIPIRNIKKKKLFTRLSNGVNRTKSNLFHPLSLLMLFCCFLLLRPRDKSSKTA